MQSHISLVAAVAGACLSAGCVIQPLPGVVYPPGPVYRGGYVEAAPLPPGPEEIIVPDVVIIEGGIVHDRIFYMHHPDIYRRDRMMHPERFASRRPAPKKDDRRRHDDRDQH